jgi:hypothetical protein
LSQGAAQHYSFLAGSVGFMHSFGCFFIMSSVEQSTEVAGQLPAQQSGLGASTVDFLHNTGSFFLNSSVVQST